jgi:hypothetical protein
MLKGKDVGSKYNVACLKHYIGYGSTTTEKTEHPALSLNEF